MERTRKELPAVMMAKNFLAREFAFVTLTDLTKHEAPGVNVFSDYDDTRIMEEFNQQPFACQLTTEQKRKIFIWMIDDLQDILKMRPEETLVAFTNRIIYLTQTGYEISLN